VVAAADPDRVRFDAVLSEEGGRFHHAQTRYQVIEVGEGFPADVPEDFIWVTVHQLMRLVRHGRYLNVEARSLLACLHGLR
jgi:oxidase EvaA